MFSKKNKRLITSVICTAMAFQIFAFIPDNRTYALDFDFSDNVTASSGHKYRKYTDNYFGCKEVATDEWFDDIP